MSSAGIEAMEARLLYTIVSDEAEPIAELSRVALLVDIDDDESGVLPKGSSGTVMSVYGDGAAYCVEFTEPFPALLTIDRGSLEVLPEETRERLIASAKNLHRRPE